MLQQTGQRSRMPGADRSGVDRHFSLSGLDAFGDPAAPAVYLSSVTSGDMSAFRESSRFNRRGFLRKIGADYSKTLYTSQIHSRSIIFTDTYARRSGIVYTADGILTRNYTLWPSVTVADCLPIFLWNARINLHGILHSGWQGTGILETALQRIQFLSSRETMRETILFLGPCIRPCCYQVDADRAAVFKQSFGDESVVFHDSGFFLDLHAANRKIASRFGIRTIIAGSECTCCSKQFGSYRREGKQFTRMLALIGFV